MVFLIYHYYLNDLEMLDLTACSFLFCRFNVPEDWPYQEVRTLFKEPNVCTGIPDFMWTSPDSQGLMDFLSTENSFSPDRVAKVVEKITVARDKYSPGRLKLLTPVASLPGSHTEKEPAMLF